jgi:RNA polymerase sigma-70 factor (ECF subfamily)
MERSQRLAVQDAMERLADGDRSAFDALFGALWPLLRAFCRRATGSEADGDDAAQEALVKVFARASSFDPERDAVSWALAVAAWECRTVRRRAVRRREHGLDGAGDARSVDAAADEVLASRQLATAAAELLGALDPRDAATILAAVSGDPAARPPVAPATFRKRLERAMARLRAAWRARHGAW